MADFNTLKGNMTNAQVLAIYNNLSSTNSWCNQLSTIFTIALNNGLFPNIILCKNATITDYINKWANKYNSFVQPSLKVAQPKQTCSDPGVKKIIEINKNKTPAEVDDMEKIHNLFMSAENVQGDLLEEFIDSKISQYGWIWCKGQILQATDFCTSNNDFLQIKNKFNTENSSSKNFRLSKNISSWYRLKQSKNGNSYVPVYNWNALNVIINSTNNPTKPVGISPLNITEADYMNFLRNVTNNNNGIVNEN